MANSVTTQHDQGWISVKDRVPEMHTKCLVTNSNYPGHYYLALYNTFYHGFQVWETGTTKLDEPLPYEATHWIPIPKLTRLEE